MPYNFRYGYFCLSLDSIWTKNKIPKYECQNLGRWLVSFWVAIDDFNRLLTTQLTIFLIQVYSKGSIFHLLSHTDSRNPSISICRTELKFSISFNNSLLLLCRISITLIKLLFGFNSIAQIKKQFLINTPNSCLFILLKIRKLVLLKPL